MGYDFVLVCILSCVYVCWVQPTQVIELALCACCAQVNMYPILNGQTTTVLVSVLKPHEVVCVAILIGIRP